jgi:hypothetical protein
MRQAEIQRLFDDLVLTQSRERLALTEAQTDPFTTRLHALQEVRRRGIGERARLLGELARLTSPRAGTPDPARVEARLEELAEFEARHAAELRQAYAGIDAVLDVMQRARFRVMEEQLERRKLQLITRARQGPRPPGSDF